MWFALTATTIKYFCMQSFSCEKPFHTVSYHVNACRQIQAVNGYSRDSQHLSALTSCSANMIADLVKSAAAINK